MIHVQVFQSYFLISLFTSICNLIQKTPVVTMAKGFGLSQRKFNVGTGNGRRKRKSDHNFLLRILICVSIPFMCIFLVTGYIFSHTDSNYRSDMNNITPHRQDQNSLGAKHEIYGHIDNINNNDPLHVSISSSGERESSQLLPKWIQDYMSWHQEMRSKFPGKAIIEDPNAPPVLVRTCLVSFYTPPRYHTYHTITVDIFPACC